MGRIDMPIAGASRGVPLRAGILPLRLPRRAVTFARCRQPEILPAHFFRAEPSPELRFTHLDILLEALYLHLGCLPKKNASASSCCKAPWTC